MSLGPILATLVAATQPGAAAPPAATVAADANAQSVTSYPAKFFASALPATAMDMIGRLPGFIFDGGDGSRGLGGAGNVLIDGRRPASKDDSLNQVLSRLSAASVLRIDVVRGGAPGIDMMGKTEIANVVRRADDGLKVTVIASNGLIFDGRTKPDLQVQTAQKTRTTEIDTSLELGTGFDNGGESGPYVRTDGSGAKIAGAQETTRTDALFDKATAAIETDAGGGRLRANLSAQSNPYSDFRNDPLYMPAGVVEFEHDKQSNVSGEMGLHYDHPLGAKASFEAFAVQRLGATDLQELYSAPDNAPTPQDQDYYLKTQTGESILRGEVKYAPNARWTLQGGVEGDFNWLINRTVYRVDGVLTPLPASNDTVQERRGEVFGSANWTLSPKLTLEAGLRVEASTISATGDVVNSNAFIFAKPRVALTWSVNANDQIRLRVEREVSQLDFGNFTGSAQLGTSTFQAGNPKITPTQDVVFEAVLDHRFWGSGEASLTLRHFIYADVLDRIPDYTPSGVYDAAGNIGAGKWDAAIFVLNLPLDKLGISQGLFTYNASLRRSSVVDPTTGQVRAFSGMHRLDQGATFSQGLPKWKALWGVDINGGWKETYYRFDEIDITGLAPFIDIYAEYKPNADTTLRMQFNNPTSRGIKIVNEIYNGPRNAVALAYADKRQLAFGQWVDMSVRKTF
jgi:hypothetical protein